MEHLPDITAANTKDESCAEHGPFVSRRIMSRIWSRCPACSKAKQDAEAQQDAEDKRKQAEARQRKLLGRAAIPERFVGRSFDNFQTDTEAKMAAVTAIRDYSEAFDERSRRGLGLILFGKPGTGKSHLAAAVLQDHIDKDVLYATCLDLIRMVRETWRKDSEQSERQVLAYLGGLDLLVIDELGVQYGTEGEQTIMFDVLDRRYRDVKPTIILTNQGADGLKAYLGERTYDRLRETCRSIPFDWESYRPTARKLEGKQA